MKQHFFLSCACLLLAPNAWAISEANLPTAAVTVESDGTVYVDGQSNNSDNLLNVEVGTLHQASVYGSSGDTVRFNTPHGYGMEIDGVPMNTFVMPGSSSYESFSFRLVDEAPRGIGASLEVEVDFMEWKASLGPLKDGSNAGYVFLKDPDLNGSDWEWRNFQFSYRVGIGNSYTPVWENQYESLATKSYETVIINYEHSSGVGSYRLRNNEMYICVIARGNGIWPGYLGVDALANAIRKYHFQRLPVVGSERALRITEYNELDEAVDVVTLYQHIDDKTWRKEDAEGAVNIIHRKRDEISDDGTLTIIRETVSDDSGIASVTEFHYERFPWTPQDEPGELIEEIKDPGAGGQNFTTVWTYYNDETNQDCHSKLKSVQHADGTWEAFDYDAGPRPSDWEIRDAWEVSRGQTLRRFFPVGEAISYPPEDPRAVDLASYNGGVELFTYHADSNCPYYGQILTQESLVCEAGSQTRVGYMEKAYEAEKWPNLTTHDDLIITTQWVGNNKNPAVSLQWVEPHDGYIDALKPTCHIDASGQMTLRGYARESSMPWGFTWVGGQEQVPNWNSSNGKPNSIYIEYTFNGLIYGDTQQRDYTRTYYSWPYSVNRPKHVYGRIIPGQSTFTARIWLDGLLRKEEFFVFETEHELAKLTFVEFDYDIIGNPTARREYHKNTSGGYALASHFEAGDYEQNRPAWQLGVDGKLRQFTYDEIGRMKQVTEAAVPAQGDYAAQGEIQTIYTYNAAHQVVQQTMTAGAEAIDSTWQYNLAGLQTHASLPCGTVIEQRREQAAVDVGTGFYRQMHQFNHTTQASETILAGGDGRIVSHLSSTKADRYFDYGYTAAGHSVTRVSLGSPTGLRVSEKETDPTGRTIRETSPSFGGGTIETQYIYDDSPYLFGDHHDDDYEDRLLPLNEKHSRLLKVTTDGQPNTLFEYDSTTLDLFRTGQDINDNGILELDSSDIIQEQTTSLILSNDDWWQETITRTYPFENDDTPYTTQRVLQRLTGFGQNEVAETRLWTNQQNVLDPMKAYQKSLTFLDRTNKLVTEQTMMVSSENPPYMPTQDHNPHQRIHYNGRVVETITPAGGSTFYDYDHLGRPFMTTDPRGVWQETVYHPGTTLVDRIVGPDANNNPIDQLTYTYEGQIGGGSACGRVIAETNALGQTKRYAYGTDGRVSHIWGDAVNPQVMLYNAYGEMTDLFTYKGGKNPDGSTIWDGTNWPTNPGPADNRSWTHDEATGLLTAKIDAEGQSVTYQYDVLNRLTQRTWARGDYTQYTYDPGTSQLIDTAYFKIGGALDPDTPSVVRSYDRLGRPLTVTDGTGLRSFTYDPVSQLLTEEILPDFYGAQRLIRHSHDKFHRREEVSFREGAASLAGQDYTFNEDDGRLNRVGDFDYNYLSTADLISSVQGPLVNPNQQHTSPRFQIDYTYEPHRNLLASVETYWTTSSTKLSTQSQYTYTHDLLGRRITNTQSGAIFASYGGNLHTKYAYDSRGQLEQTTTKDVLDVPLAGRMEDWRYDMAGNREDWQIDQAPWATYTAPEAADDRYISIFIPEAGSTQHQYDLDGNLTADGRWRYQWDGENRLISMHTHEDAIAAGELKQQLDFYYDYLGRRVEKKVFLGDDPLMPPTASSRFLYDGWNLLTEFDTTPGDEHVYFPAQEHPAWKVFDRIYGFPATLTVDQSNQSIAMHGNGRYTLAHHTYIAPEASLTFEVKIYEGGEYVGISCNEDTFRHNGEIGFKLAGSRTLNTNGWIDSYPIPADGQWHLITIPVGQYQTGSVNHLIFFGSADTGPSADFEVRNVHFTHGEGRLDPERTYTWGLDLSGTLQGGGGVGGLLALTDHTGPSAVTYAAGYDGNGNLTSLTDVDTGTIAAAYEYSPFGEILRATGPYADINPIKFSTKYTDAETGLAYYGYRYYDPHHGRFLGRDPIAEAGGINLYAFVGNDPVNAWDYLGMCVPISADLNLSDRNSMNNAYIDEVKRWNFDRGTSSSMRQPSWGINQETAWDRIHGSGHVDIGDEIKMEEEELAYDLEMERLDSEASLLSDQSSKVYSDSFVGPIEADSRRASVRGNVRRRELDSRSENYLSQSLWDPEGSLTTGEAFVAFGDGLYDSVTGAPGIGASQFVVGLTATVGGVLTSETGGAALIPWGIIQAIGGTTNMVGGIVEGPDFQGPPWFVPGKSDAEWMIMKLMWRGLWTDSGEDDQDSDSECDE